MKFENIDFNARICMNLLEGEKKKELLNIFKEIKI